MRDPFHGGRLLFIPTYNEAGNIREMVARLRDLGTAMDILFIDDRSPDGTGAIIDGVTATDSAVHVIHRPGKGGVGSAHLEAIAFAYEKGYPVLVTMDADFTHPPEAVPSLIQAAADADLVLGSRFVGNGAFVGWSPWRRALSVAGHWFTGRLLGLPWDATGAFRVYRLDRIPRRAFGRVRSAGYAFFFESLLILAQHRIRIKEVPVRAEGRKHGRSKMGVRDMAASMGTAIRLLVRFRRGDTGRPGGRRP